MFNYNISNSPNSRIILHANTPNHGLDIPNGNAAPIKKQKEPE